MLPVAALSVLSLNPTTGTTICPFALITGTACPGCGLTRATLALSRGEFGTALTFHPLVMLVLAWLIGAWGVAVAKRSGYSVRVNYKVVDRLLWATGALLVITWIVRLAGGTLPPI